SRVRFAPASQRPAVERDATKGTGPRQFDQSRRAGLPVDSGRRAICSPVAGQGTGETRKHILQTFPRHQQALRAQPLIDMQAIGAAPAMPMPADNQQHAIMGNTPAKTPGDFIEEAIKLQNAAAILIAARIGWIARIAVAPQEMLREIERIQLKKEEVIRLAVK